MEYDQLLIRIKGLDTNIVNHIEFMAKEQYEFNASYELRDDNELLIIGCKAGDDEHFIEWLYDYLQDHGIDYLSIVG